VPLYPFGYGLSYTNFTFAGLTTNKKIYKKEETITVTVNISNTGKYAGKETVQLYVSKPASSVERADKELKAFKKVMVPQDGISKTTLTIPVKDLAYYDVKNSKWVVEPGEYKLLAATSAADIKATCTVTIQ
ncbi:MAG: fibronectin type III-like domain-contianing protein, partial [Ferruginibacter sp.]|nr:fibronectin type III-like domain-contianing protein [Ferruginibacter sp.]